MSGAFFMMMAAAGAKPKYTPLAYLESTGTQYIDTGTAPDFAGGDEVEIHYLSPSSSGSLCIFGSRTGGVRNGFYALGGGACTIADSSSFTAIYIATGEVILQVSDAAIIDNGRSAAMPKRVTCAFPMYLFALNNGGNTFGIYNGCRVYRWKYWHNGALAQDLIPALDANGVPCMWDVISNTAKYNAGTGTFNYA